MKTTTPDEQGWYWAKQPDGEWIMTFVDTDEERICLFGGIDGARRGTLDIDREELKRWKWYGPFTCPGGDFGNHTVVMDEELHQFAKREKKAMALTCIDFRYCADEKHGSIITTSAAVSREKADAMLKREAEAFVEGSTGERPERSE